MNAFNERPEQPLLLPHELDALITTGIERHFSVGERLVSIGAESTEVFYLVEGLVKIVVVSTSGTESVFGLRTPGVFIGDMATLNNARRSADVVAVSPTRTIMLSSSRFIDYLQDYPAVALSLLREQTRRLNEMTIRSMLGSRSVKARVAQRLIELSEGTTDRRLVQLTQADLAQYIDASREWTSKALGELRRDGAIRTERGRVVVLDHDLLLDATLED